MTLLRWGFGVLSIVANHLASQSKIQPYSHRSALLLWQWGLKTWPIQTQCPSLGIRLKFWQLKIALAGYSARCLKQTLTIGLGLPAASHHQVVTSWQLRIVSKTQGHRSNETTKTIIELQSQVSWYQVHLWTTWCSNMVFVIDNAWLAQKSNDRTTLQVVEVFHTIYHLCF